MSNCDSACSADMATGLHFGRSLGVVVGKLGLGTVISCCGCSCSGICHCYGIGRCRASVCGPRRSACSLGVVNGRRDARLGAKNSGDNGHELCLRTDLSCGEAFGSIRGIGIVFLCGRRRGSIGGPSSLLASLPEEGRNVTKHLSCKFTNECLTRFGFNCGNSRGFPGGGGFNFFPSMTVKCGLSRRGF